MTFTHHGIVNNSVYIQQSDKDGRKIMEIQKQLGYLNQNRFINSDLSDLLVISRVEKDFMRGRGRGGGGGRGRGGGGRGGGGRGGRGGGDRGRGGGGRGGGGRGGGRGGY
mmetsp:Transcript_30211/g.25441  ORF Transcript_30211/g.25441 Transcript_30211/m.25441 type:complete len:110 (+) Transcript_30211:2564-2893(+)